MNQERALFFLIHPSSFRETPPTIPFSEGGGRPQGPGRVNRPRAPPAALIKESSHADNDSQTTGAAAAVRPRHARRPVPLLRPPPPYRPGPPGGEHRRLGADP